MGQLLFKKCFWQPIRDGAKRTTIRRWLRPRLKPGQRAYSPGLGWLLIDSVDLINLEDLHDADALADGFPTVREMRRALHELYPHTAHDNRSWFRIAFRNSA
jgi:hypothetical protein